MDRHVLAAISISGIALDLLGGLYLAYDLLGGKQGPLGTLTRSVTYGWLFGLGFGIPLGLPMGLSTGITLGVTLGHEISEATRGRIPAPKSSIFLWTVVRSLGYGIGSAFILGPSFGVWFGVLACAGQLFAYRIGFTPTIVLEANARPKLKKWHLLGSLNRTIGYGLNGAISGLLANEQAQGVRFGIEAGLVVGFVSALLSFVVPYLEWFIGRLPERRLGAFGAILVVIGFLLQSLQYWVTVLDIPVQ
jgi:hypothetical protein